MVVKVKSSCARCIIVDDTIGACIFGLVIFVLTIFLGVVSRTYGAGHMSLRAVLRMMAESQTLHTGDVEIVLTF